MLQGPNPTSPHESLKLIRPIYAPQAADMGPPEFYDPSALLNTPKDKQLTVL